MYRTEFYYHGHKVVRSCLAGQRDFVDEFVYIIIAFTVRVMWTEL